MNYQLNEYLKDFSDENTVKSEFEDRIKDYFKCRYAVHVVNGTVAIEIGLKALGIPRGASVIIPDISFIATATAVANCGLIPIYADVSRDYFGITLESVKKQYNKNVAAVIAVHFSGAVNREILEIKAFCKEKGIFLIEDCAQAFPCTIDGIRVGTIGDLGTFSFQSSKIVNSGEGGLITANSDEIGLKCRAYTNWGVSIDDSTRNLNMAAGNYRMSALQCYFILKQLDCIDNIVKERLDKYEELLKVSKELGIEPASPKADTRCFDVPFFYPVKSHTRYYTVEPRTEYPMWKSSFVKAILKQYYPDLLDQYNQALNNSINNINSVQVLQSIDFINIRQFDNLSPIELLKVYKK
jgi:perosamine synthetase